MKAYSTLKAASAASSTHLGRTLRDLRLAAGLTKHQLVEAMGYRNPSKGLSRLAEWESGRDFPREDRPYVLARALGCPLEQVLEPLEQHLEALGQFQRAAGALLAADAEAVAQNKRWLAEHYQLLSGNYRRILAWPDWRDIKVLGASGSASYIGGRSFTVGELLDNWFDGTLAVLNDRKRLLVYSFSGSPLSGSNWVEGFYSQDGEPYSGRLPSRLRNFGGFAKQALGGASVKASDWPLADLLAALGVQLAPVVIREANGGASWHYDRHTRQLHPPGQPPIQLGALQFKSPRLTERHERRGLSFRIVNGGFRPGSWSGTHLEDPRRRWRARPTHLWVEGKLAFHWDGILPASVIELLARSRLEG
jgi:transcriptional regulator with XRE-family HTH domain